VILKQIIEYASNDNSYAGLIQDIVNEGHFKANIVKADGAIIVYIDEGEDEIKAFFAALGERLPLSVYMGQSRVEEAPSFPPHTENIGTYKKWAACDPKVLMKIVDENSSEYLNPFVLTDMRAQSVNINGKEYTQNSESLREDIKKVAALIVSGQDVSFENENAKFALGMNKGSSSTIESLFCIDLNKVAVKYKIPNVALFALSSMERPFVTVGVLDENEQNRFIRLTLASDPLLLSIAKLVGDAGVSELCLKSHEVANKNVIKYSGVALPFLAPEVLIQKDRKLFLTKEQFDPNILPIYQDTLVAHFSDIANSSFMAIRPTVHSKELLRIVSFDGPISKSIEALDENGHRLIENFESRFPKVIAKCDTNIGKYDFEKFVKASAIVLGWDERESALAHLIDLAHKNMAPAGVKIDFILETDGAPTLNLIKSFRTLLSYKLADVEDAVLAFSIFESFADFIAILSEEARKGFDAKEIVLCGGMFYSQALSDRVYTKARNIRVSSAYIPQIFEVV
jgi:hypothetical protein